MLPVFIPLPITSPVWLWYVISWGMPLPWLSVPVSFLAGLGVGFLLNLLVISLCIKIYEEIWEKGYLRWKETQNLPPNEQQKQLNKIKQILERHMIEYQIKKDTPAAQKIWEEYQIVLSLCDGIETFDEIKLNSWYNNCLKGYDELR